MSESTAAVRVRGAGALSRSWRVNARLGMLYTGGPLRLSPDQRVMAAWCAEDVNIVSIDTGKVLYTIQAEDDGIMSFTLSPKHNNNGTLHLATAHKSNLIKLWTININNNDKADANMDRCWKGHDFPVTDMAFDPTGTLLATGSVDRTVRVWNVAQGFATHSFRGHSQMIDKVVFHPTVTPNHMKLYVGVRDGQIKCWDLLTKQAIDMPNHVSSIADILVIKRLGLVVTLGRDKVVNLWNSDTSQHIKTIPVYDELEAIESLGESFGSCEPEEHAEYFVTGGAIGSLKVWKLSQSESGSWSFKKIEERTVSFDVTTTTIANADPVAIQILTYVKEFNQLMVVTSDQNIHFLAVSGDSFSRSKMLIGFNDRILHLKYFPDGVHIAAVTNSNQIRVFNLATSNSYVLLGHTQSVLSLDVSPCGSYLISSGKDAIINLWRIEYHESNLKFSFIAQGQGHTESVTCVAFSHKGLTAVSGASDRTLKLWDCTPASIISGKLTCTKSVVAHQKDINSVKFSPNDQLIGSSSLDKTIKIWNSRDLTLQNTFSGHKRGVWDIAFSPVEKLLVSASADKTIKLWTLNSSSNPCLKTFEGHTTSVLRVDFINAGLQLLSAGSDGLVKLWIIKTNECTNTFADEHDDKITAMCLSSDKTQMITGGTDSVLNVWEDVTAQDAEESELERQSFLLKDQELQNRIRQRQYGEAIKLALELKHPRRLYSIVEELLEDLNVSKLDEIICNLTADELLESVKYVRDWNVNSKKSVVAQGLLNRVVSCRGSLFEIYEDYKSQKDQMKENEDVEEMEVMTRAEIQELIDSIVAYTERHLQRATGLYQNAFLIDYLSQSAEKLNPLEQHLASREALKRKEGLSSSVQNKRQRISAQ